jgi:hypothetical protein
METLPTDDHRILVNVAVCCCYRHDVDDVVVVWSGGYIFKLWYNYI